MTLETQHEVRKMRLADLEPFAKNPRTITEEAAQGLRESLEGFGMLEMPVVNVKDSRNRIVSGHQRITQLLAQGVAFADCIVVNFDDIAEISANLTMNNTTIQGRFDASKLDEKTLKQLERGLAKPDFARFDALTAQLRGKLEGAARLDTLASDRAEVEETTKVRSRKGRVYQLGRHRVYCGDFRDGVTKLLGVAKKVDVTITDPPYGLSFADSSGATVTNDDLQGEEWTEFLLMMSKTILRRTKGASYVFFSKRELPAMVDAWSNAGGHLAQWVVWAHKLNPNWKGDYKNQTELILFGHKPGVVVAPIRARTNVIDTVKRHWSNTLHPCQTPVALLRELFEDATTEGQTVLDLFAGSGGTVVVAEELGRTCVACEIEPKYVDVIRKRWCEQVHGSDEGWTKETPVLKKR